MSGRAVAHGPNRAAQVLYGLPPGDSKLHLLSMATDTARDADPF